ncbi:CPBP family intramembrane glutamic endopeptidase [Aeoliella mucimassa]|uniref:CAAX amino terminal protease self-immunity n=1 Tax=Aeoliella mucimassa TaxID=2527972 RepID=A0A518AQR8_9BACT|nr:CPBP family intramembrane glutamic endopeptidase [Aeoliella mucimassa]QDU57056.1 CAAX amino terminal protease self- immunity [Aeoliella mucimassa]
MDQANLEVSPFAAMVLSFVLLASLASCAIWIARWTSKGYVLGHQPRRPVPWGWGAALPAMLLTSAAVLSTITKRLQPPVEEVAEFDATSFLDSQVSFIVFQFALLLGVIVLLVITCGARGRDFGMPRSVTQFFEDIGLGLWSGFTCLVPVYVIQVLSVMVLGIPPGHPLLDRMMENPDMRVFIAAGFSAVIAAPILEEIMFRLLMQGGLEHIEHRALNPPPALVEPTLAEELSEEPIPAPSPVDTAAADAAPAEPPPTPTIGRGSEVWEELEPDLTVLPPEPPSGQGALPGLGIGWGPILASSFFFGLAHLGSGPSPIPLFVFALFQGYLYQRTHRIVPCIVAHMLINSISIGTMVLMLLKS